MEPNTLIIKGIPPFLNYIREISGLKPGDVARTNWRVRCAQPPYDVLPIPRADLPEGVVLSREADAWIRVDRIGDVALPFYEGRMIGQFDYSQKGWISGKGRTAVWRDIPWSRKSIEPQYLMAEADYRDSRKSVRKPKVAYMRVASSTNSRSTIATYLGCYPSGDSVFHFVPNSDENATATVLSTVFSTFVFDTVIRLRLGGLNLSEFIMAEAALPKKDAVFSSTVMKLAADLNCGNFTHPTEYSYLSNRLLGTRACITPRRRSEQIAMLDAITAVWFGLGIDDVRYIFMDCDAPTTIVLSQHWNPKGFWRVDRNLAPELRQTTLTQVAFRDLSEKFKDAGGSVSSGIEKYLAQNRGEGWIAPETVSINEVLASQVDPAGTRVPLACRLGPRFYDWQLVL